MINLIFVFLFWYYFPWFFNILLCSSGLNLIYVFLLCFALFLNFCLWFQIHKILNLIIQLFLIKLVCLCEIRIIIIIFMKNFPLLLFQES